jgi:hypothetical protein
MAPTDHPQTTELAALEQEKEIFRQEALDYKAKLLQLEKEKEHWSLKTGGNIRHGSHYTCKYRGWIKH